MSDRRKFLKKLGLAATMSAVGSSAYGSRTENLADKWARVKKQFLCSPDQPLNFNTGSAGIMPRPIFENYKKNLELVHAGAPYEVANSYVPQVQDSMDRLSSILNATEGELALMPNTTTALNAILYGIEWKEGDELICSNVDYPLVFNTIRLLEHKYGIVSKKVNLKLSENTPDEILAIYKNAYTSKTRLLLVTHMTHKEGHIMPAKELGAQAHEHGVQVLLDGAHSAGHFEFSLEDLDCDYYATSLHKWMSAPHGTGLLYVKRERLKELSPPISYNQNMEHKMSMFTVHGTSAFQNAMTLKAVLDFQEGLGLADKEARLREMVEYLREGLSEIDNMELMTAKAASGGICSFRIKETRRMGSWIKRFELEHNIHIKYSSYPNESGFLRTSLNIHLDESDIDLLLTAVQCLAHEK